MHYCNGLQTWDRPPWSHQGNEVNTDSYVGSIQSGAVLVSQRVDI